MDKDFVGKERNKPLDGKSTDVVALLSSQFPLVAIPSPFSSVQDYRHILSLEHGLHTNTCWVVCPGLNNGTSAWKLLLGSEFFSLFSKSGEKVNVPCDCKACLMLLCSLTEKRKSWSKKVWFRGVIQGETGTDAHFITIILAVIWVLNWSRKKKNRRKKLKIIRK